MNVFSFGGGVQSTAALVLAAQGELPVDAFLFANVGDDSENPATLAYIRDVARPYAARHGLRIEEVRYTRRDARQETLYTRVMGGGRGLIIPVKLAGSGPMRRQCTADFKIRPINKWLREHGATPARPATVMLGISLDEYQRMRRGDDVRYVRRAYPLIDRRMSRRDCQAIIAAAGLPIPPKSSCFFCPYHSRATWVAQQRDEPGLFERSVAIEERLSAWSVKRGSRPVYLLKDGAPLSRLRTDLRQSALFDDAEDSCESGYCMV